MAPSEHPEQFPHLAASAEAVSIPSSPSIPAFMSPFTNPPAAASATGEEMNALRDQAAALEMTIRAQSSSGGKTTRELGDELERNLVYAKTKRLLENGTSGAPRDAASTDTERVAALTQEYLAHGEALPRPSHCRTCHTTKDEVLFRIRTPQASTKKAAARLMYLYHEDICIDCNIDGRYAPGVVVDTVDFSTSWWICQCKEKHRMPAVPCPRCGTSVSYQQQRAAKARRAEAKMYVSIGNL